MTWYLKSLACCCLVAASYNAFAQNTNVSEYYYSGYRIDYSEVDRLINEVRGGKKSDVAINAQKQFQIGLTFEYGKGVQVDYKEAFFWYKKSAELDNPSAQFALARMFEEGKGVAKDLKQAANWYEKSADQGALEAQYNLALMYALGEGVKQDLTKAYAWYEKAAQAGYVKAQHNLALQLAKGEGVTVDFVRAHMWLTLAMTLDKSQENSQKSLLLLESHMSPEQMEQSKMMVKAWLALQPPNIVSAK
ncbi:MAG: sel1 repeat family protein [Undibacterium sp.]|nr:sel1 repeat family protein [Undibacterium sp.]